MQERCPGARLRGRRLSRSRPAAVCRSREVLRCGKTARERNENGGNRGTGTGRRRGREKGQQATRNRSVNIKRKHHFLVALNVVCYPHLHFIRIPSRFWSLSLDSPRQCLTVSTVLDGSLTALLRVSLVLHTPHTAPIPDFSPPDSPMKYIQKRLFSLTRRCLDSLAFVETANGKVTSGSLSTITAAAQLGEPVTALVAGPEGEAVSKQAAAIEGVSQVLVAKDARFDHYLAEELSPLIKSVIESRNFSHFVTPSSAVGKSLLPRLGAIMDLQPVSEIIKVESKDTFVRPIYAGNALATVKSNEKTILFSVRPSAFAPAATGSAEAPIEEIGADTGSQCRTEFVSEDLVTSERPDLGSAKIVVAGGRGLKDKETFDKLLEPLATKLNAAVGASRAAVDAGYCDNSLQIGQTGKVVAPDLYIGVGISGAIQHLAGMKDSKTIVAINKDPEAPLFNVADIGLVADLNESLAELTEKL